MPQFPNFRREGLHNPVVALFLKANVLGGFFVWLVLFVQSYNGGSYSLCGENAFY